MISNWKHELIELAQDSSSSGLHKLLFKLSELLATPNKVRRHDVVVAINALYCTGKIRYNDLPLSVALHLAHGDIDEAHEVLVECLHLPDNELVNIIHKNGRHHSRAISNRQDINVAVTDALLLTKDLETVVTVAKNLGAKLSPLGVAIAVNMAFESEELVSPLIYRNETGTKHAATLYYLTSSKDDKEGAIKKWGLTHTHMNSGLMAAVERMTSRLEFCDDDTVDQVAKNMVARGMVTVDTIMYAADKGIRPLLFRLLEAMSGVPHQEIRSFIDKDQCDRFAAVARYIDLSPPQFASVFLRANGSRVRPPGLIGKALTIYSHLSHERAARIIKHIISAQDYAKKAAE